MADPITLNILVMTKLLQIVSLKGAPCIII